MKKQKSKLHLFFLFFSFVLLFVNERTIIGCLCREATKMYHTSFSIRVIYSISDRPERHYIFLINKCKFFKNSQRAKRHHFYLDVVAFLFSPLCGVVERCCGLSKFVACQRKHKYVPSCNLLGELVIIEKLKPANCVCTKTKLLFVMQTI